MQFTQGLHRAVQQRPNAIATVCGTRTYTFKQLHDRVSRFAGALLARGIKRHDRIAILGLNSDRYLECYLASAWIGAVVNPINFRWSVPEIVYSLTDSGSSVLIVDDQFAPQAAAIRAGSGTIQRCIFMGDGACPTEMLSMEAMISDGPAVNDAEIGHDDLFGIFYTGGTTGKPKGVMLSHLNIATSAMAVLTEGMYPEGTVALHAAPMFHLADMMVTASVLLRGGQHIVLPAFRPDLVLDLIQQWKITDLLLVPAMLQMLADHPSTMTSDTSSVARVLYGASPISEAILDRAMDALPSATFTQIYGMTEMSAVMTALSPALHQKENRALSKLRSGGRACCHVQVRIVDPEDHELARGQVGEICVRGPNIMKGYLNQPEATAETLRHGWMHTGDMGYMDEDGYVFIVDRLKDMIISGGENVYSTEVENAIAKHSSIASVAVIGIPSEEWGEAVHASVVLKPGAQLSLEELIAHCKTLIAGYKCPRSLDILEALPLSGAGKVLKTTLRDKFWQSHARKVN